MKDTDPMITPQKTAQGRKLRKRKIMTRKNGSRSSNQNKE